MFIRALMLKDALHEYHEQHEATYLRLNKEKSFQVEYLIDLIKLFCNFTKLIEKNKQSTIQRVFEIYNVLFNYFDRARQKLSQKLNF